MDGICQVDFSSYCPLAPHGMTRKGEEKDEAETPIGGNR
jgi:hypothetical protein